MSAAPLHANGEEQLGSGNAGELIRVWAAPIAMVLVGVGGLLGGIALGIGSGAEPGPGMWPAIVSAVVIASGLLMGPQRETEALDRDEARKTFAALVLMALFIFIFSLVGVLIPTFLIMFLWLKLLAVRGWRTSLLVAASTAGVFYAVFTLFFGVGS